MASPLQMSTSVHLSSINSLYRVGLAINQGSFAKAYNVSVGAQWHIEIKGIEN